MEDKRKKQDSDLGDWLIIAALFFFDLSPIVLFLIFAKLFGKDDKKRQTTPPLNTQYQQVKREKASQRSTYRGSTTQSTSRRVQQDEAGSQPGKTRKMMRTPAAKSSTAKWLQIVGVILFAIGALSMGDSVQTLLSHPGLAWWHTDLLDSLTFLISGGALFGSGFSMNRSLGRYARYLAVLGEREAVSLDELARITGYSRRKVGKDLEKMLEKGYFGGKAYLNMELGYFFRSSDADAAWNERQQKKESVVPKETEEGYSGILRNIRRANDSIADPVLSEKIDRLEAITAKIFREVETHPEKEQQIATFLSYYLPTTQKLLDSYANFESAGIEGENLRQAKSRIENTMDTILRGFERQLDQLYHMDAMDVASDIQVMETMLRRDTATVADDFGSAVVAEKEEF